MKLVFNKPLGLGNVYAPDQMCIAPAIIAAGIGAAGSILGGVLSSSTQSGFTKEQQRLQSKLNREEMQYSMGLQRDYQNMVWETGAGKEVSGMRNAGLNPATAGGTSVGGASVAKPTSGASGPSAGMPNIDPVGAAMDAQRIQNETKVADAQSNALNAQAQKDLSSKGLIDKDVESYADRLASQLANQGAQTALYGANTEESRQKKELYKSQILEIDENINEIRQRVEESKERTKLTKEQRENYRSYIGSVIKANMAQANIHNTSASMMLQNALFDWSMSTSEADLADSQKQLQDVIVRLTNEYGDAERIIRMVNETISSIGGVALDMVLFKGLGGTGAKAIKGFGTGVATAGKFKRLFGKN